MKTLHLTLKKKWFDVIASGEKKEEYREIKEYWVTRLCEKHPGSIGGNFMDRHKPIAYTFKKFDTVTFSKGYTKTRRVVELLGISIGKAKPEWSDNWQGEVFVIKLGKILTPAPADKQ